MRAVVDQVEAVGNLPGLMRLAVAGGQRRAELGLVGIGGFVQVDVHQHAVAQWRDQAHQRRRLRRRAVVAERAVRVERIRVPAVDALVAPRADARCHDQVDPARIVRRMPVEELQRAVHAAGLVAVHAAGHQHAGKLVAPAAAADREQRVAVGRVIESAVLRHVEARAQGLDRAQHVRFVAALHGLSRPPGGDFPSPPGTSGCADRIGGISHRVARSAGTSRPATLTPE